MSLENWKDIPGYENLYQASTDGRIRSCAGKITYSVRCGERHWKQRIIKQYCGANERGRIDAKVKLYKDKKQYTHLVSRLIALTWCPGYAEGLTVNHIDGNPLNNAADNLEWLSREENIKKGFADGLYSAQKKVILENRNGEKVEFSSMAAASRYMGKNPGYISNRLKKQMAGR